MFRDWEEKEQLHVESDIWRSKFLASTVILDEMTRSKQLLDNRNQQLEHAARRILLERKDIVNIRICLVKVKLKRNKW